VIRISGFIIFERGCPFLFAVSAGGSLTMTRGWPFFYIKSLDYLFNFDFRKLVTMIKSIVNHMQ